MNWYKELKFAGLPAYSYRQIAKKLKNLGFIVLRQGKGDHEIWGRPNGSCSAALPVTKEPSSVTVRDTVVKRLGIPWQSFLRA